MANELTLVDALGRLLPSLAVIIGSLLAFRWFMRRGRGITPPDLRVVARTGLTKGAAVAVVEVGTQRFLVGTTDQQVRLLAELGQDAPPALASVTELDLAPAVNGGMPLTMATEAVTDRPGMGQRQGLADRLRLMTRRRMSAPIGIGAEPRLHPGRSVRGPQR